MPSISNAAKRRRYCLLASSILVPAVFACISQANAQQSASPNLLPPVTVDVPALPPKAIHPAETKKPRRIARARVPKPSQATTPAPAPWPAGPAVPLVVSPTGIVGPISQTPSSVTVITAQEIQTQQYRTVPEALATAPGLNVVPTGGSGGQTSVFIRGTNSNHTKVLIDGIDVGDPSTPNGAFDFGQRRPQYRLRADAEGGLADRQGRPQIRRVSRTGDPAPSAADGVVEMVASLRGS